MRDSKGRWVKGYSFWTGKKRPGLKTKSQFKKGFTPWNKGIDNRPTCKDCDKKIEYESTYCSHHAKMGLRNPKWKGGKPNCKICGKIIQRDLKICQNCNKGENHYHWKGGQPKCQECGILISYNAKSKHCIRCFCKKYLSGANNHLWRGGITPINKTIRSCNKMDIWIKTCLQRDDFTCQDCGNRGAILHVDHIKSFAQILFENSISTLEKALTCKELWDLRNGRSLCVSCHKKTPSYLKYQKFEGRIPLRVQA